MPKLDSIVQLINTGLQSTVFNTSRYQGGQFENIADLVTETIDDTKTTKPCTVDADGECEPVIINDNYPIQIYHRILSLNNERPASTDNYGDIVTVRETAQMTMVIISDRKRISISGEDLIAMLAVNLIPTISQANLTTLDLYSCDIYPSGEAVIDSEQVYNREYNTGEYLLKPNSIMYSLNYTIVTVFDSRCFPTCE